MKTNYLKHNNYLGSVEFDIEGGILFGKILFINDIITYEGDTITELTSQFKDAVTDYLATCETLHRQPQKAHSGSLNIRIGEKAHRDAAILAFKNGKKLNEFIKEAVTDKILSYQEKNEKSQVTVTVQHVYKSEEPIVTQPDSPRKGDETIFTKFDDPYTKKNQEILH
jgi:predicted HicB family RNase H-like nuclease